MGPDPRAALLMRLAPAIVACALGVSAAAGDTNKPVDFARDVQPIFAKHCYACHGEKKQKAGLRLDHRPDALLPKLLKPGHSDQSRLIELVTAADADDRMPPDGAPLPADQVGI